MLNKEIDYLHTPEVSLEVLFAVRGEKISQRWRGAGALGNRFQKLWRRLRDAVIAQQRLVQCRRLALRSWNLFISLGTKCVNNFVHELWIVCRIYRKRIADLKVQSPSGQVEFKMARILC